MIEDKYIRQDLGLCSLIHAIFGEVFYPCLCPSDGTT